MAVSELKAGTGISAGGGDNGARAVRDSAAGEQRGGSASRTPEHREVASD